MTHLLANLLPFAVTDDLDIHGPLLKALYDMGFHGIVKFFHEDLGFGLPEAGLPEILFATFLSFLLTSMIGALYKATFRGPTLSQDYVHTLIILGIVVTVIVLVVRGGDKDKAQATAFGMFAAFSIIRFRTTLAQARDIGFVFLAMAAGLATGARQYGLGCATTVVICAIIYFFSQRNWFAPTQASHLLRVRVTNDINYDVAFAETFAKFLEHYDLTSVETIQAGMMTELRFNIRLKTEAQSGDFIASLQQVNGNNRIMLTSTASMRLLGGTD
jgi:hypothetical protein